ncbi:MAG: agglutinin biogenesis protein MshP [Pseudomonadota bacterium]
MRTFHRKQGGVTLVTAIFLMAVLGALSVAMVALNTSQQKSSTLDVTGVHTYLAGKAGLEWGLYDAIQNDQCTGAATTFKVDINLPSNYFVTVVCSETTPTQFSIPRRRITATACNRAAACVNTENSPDYVQRVLAADF